MVAVKIGGALSGSAKGVRDLLDFAVRNIDDRTLVVTSAVKGATNLLADSVRSVADGSLGLLDAVKAFQGLHIGLMEDLGLRKDLLLPELGRLEQTLRAFAGSGRASRADSDLVLRFGEDCAVSIISEFFNQNGLHAIPFTSDNALVVTNDVFGMADVIMERTIDNVRDRLGNLGGAVPIISGFVGKTLDGKITTTGRNSSDYTACVVAGALGCKRVYICKDVDGMMSADPYVVDDAKCISNISFQEALEVSELGGKVVHPRAVRSCIDFGMELKLCRLGAKECEGTLISSRLSGETGFLAVGCKKGTSIISITSPSMVGVYGFLERVFRIFALHRVSVDAISTSHSSISVTVDSVGNVGRDVIGSLVEDLSEIGEVTVEDGSATVGIVSAQGRPFDTSSINAVLGLLDGVVPGVRLISWSKSGMSFSFVVDSCEAHKVVRCLHKGLF